MSAYRSKAVPGIRIEPRTALDHSPRRAAREFIYREHPDAAMIGCVVILGPQDLRDGWREVETVPLTDMDLVLEAAESHCEEYGGRELHEAIVRVRAAQL